MTTPQNFLLSAQCRLRLKRHQNRKWQFNLSALIEFYFPLWRCCDAGIDFLMMLCDAAAAVVNSAVARLRQTLITESMLYYAGSMLASRCRARQNLLGNANERGNCVNYFYCYI